MAAPGGAVVRLALPKGRMEAGVLGLLTDSGIRLRSGPREYRPFISLEGFDVKLLKPQSIVEMLHIGSRDIGFAGADWVAELGAEVVELLDTGLDPVKIVAALPPTIALDAPREVPLIVASEYERLTANWIARRGLNARVIRSYGATEVFPPEDADCIVDNTSTGATLRANGLEIVDLLMASSTRLYANPKALGEPARRAAIDRFVMVVGAVLEARRRVMVEVNVTAATLEAVIAVLPCMREPTVSPLHGNAGFAVKAAVPRELLPTLIPDIKAKGGTDIIVSELSQIVP